MYVVIERKRMDVACYAQGKLLFELLPDRPIGRYSILYIICMETGGIEPRKGPVAFSGESSSRMRVLERLRAYLRHVKPVEIPSEAYFLLGTDVTKAPMDLISLLICE